MEAFWRPADGRLGVRASRIKGEGKIRVEDLRAGRRTRTLSAHDEHLSIRQQYRGMVQPRDAKR